MGYMKLNNVNVRDNGKKKNIFQKVNELKSKIKVVLPELDGRNLLTIMVHLRAEWEGKYYYGRTGHPKWQKELTVAERMVKEILLQEGVNPSTAYRWFLATRIPQDIMDKLEQGKISHKAAYDITLNRRRNQKSSNSIILMEQIRDAIQRF